MKSSSLTKVYKLLQELQILSFYVTLCSALLALILANHHLKTIKNSWQYIEILEQNRHLRLALEIELLPLGSLTGH